MAKKATFGVSTFRGNKKGGKTSISKRKKRPRLQNLLK